VRERTGSRWRVIPVLVVLLGLVTAGTVPATADEGWTIETFDVAISVHPDATMTVRETLQVDFKSQQHHGIFRDIPVLYEWDQRHNRAYDLAVDSVTDASGRSWSYKVLDNGVYKEIKIGDPNQTLSGRQSYVIAYTVKGALNGFADHDELYWNVTGNQWAVPIKEASATVTAPAGGASLDALLPGRDRLAGNVSRVIDGGPGRVRRHPGARCRPAADRGGRHEEGRRRRCRADPEGEAANVPRILQRRTADRWQRAAVAGLGCGLARPDGVAARSRHGVRLRLLLHEGSDGACPAAVSPGGRCAGVPSAGQPATGSAGFDPRRGRGHERSEGDHRRHGGARLRGHQER